MCEFSHINVMEITSMCLGTSYKKKLFFTKESKQSNYEEKLEFLSPKWRRKT